MNTETALNPATRTKRIKKALRAAKVGIVACHSVRPAWTLVRIYDPVAAVEVLNAAGFDRIDRSDDYGGAVLRVWA